MAYHRFSFYDAATGAPYFVKAHDDRLLEEEWRQAEMLQFLKRENKLYEHLKQNQYPYIPESVCLQENMLLLSGLRNSEGWLWRAPKDKNTLGAYITDVFRAFDSLESVKPHPDTAGDEVTIDVFYNNGWDKLHDINVNDLIGTNIQKWRKHLHPETAPAAQRIARNLGDFAIKRRDITPSVLNHHDARQTNIAWHPELGVNIVDWSWADMGLQNADKTMLLLDLYKAGHDIDHYLDSINPTYAKLLLGYWLWRSQTEHMEGNQSVRMHQFISAIKTGELLLKL